ncbi:MAG: class I SAM-dependent methyltransferase [Ilumatobacter sp.]
MATDEASAPDWARYGRPIDLSETWTSHVMVLDAVGADRPQRILELGPSAGQMTAILSEWGHRVTCIEIDPEAAAIAAPHAEQMVVGDLDAVDDRGNTLLDGFAGADFDALIAADVLEHTRRPSEVLRQAMACLRPDAEVHLSIPNVAHADIRLALLGGEFDYVESGLMDRTHIQMFTVASLTRMIRDVGLAPTSFRRADRPIGESEVPVDDVLVELGRRVLANDPDATTYQWVVTCRRSEFVDEPIWPDEDVDRHAIAGVGDLLAVADAPPPPPTSVRQDANALSRRVLGGARRRVTALLGRSGDS